MDSPPKIVLDTSVIVAALFGSKSSNIIKSWHQGALILCYSDPIFHEYRTVLRKIPPIRKKAGSFLEDISTHPHVIYFKFPSRIQLNIEDPDDRKFVECAHAAKADYLVSLDEHLLSIESYKKTLIVTPRKFFNRMT